MLPSVPLAQLLVQLLAAVLVRLLVRLSMLLELLLGQPHSMCPCPNRHMRHCN